MREGIEILHRLREVVTRDEGTATISHAALVDLLRGAGLPLPFDSSKVGIDFEKGPHEGSPALLVQWTNTGKAATAGPAAEWYVANLTHPATLEAVVLGPYATRKQAEGGRPERPVDVKRIDKIANGAYQVTRVRNPDPKKSPGYIDVKGSIVGRREVLEGLSYSFARIVAPPDLQ